MVYRKPTSTTARYRDWLRFIHEYRHQYRVAPSLNILSLHFGMTAGGAAYHMNRMAARGLLRFEFVDGWKYKSVKLTAKGRRMIAEDGNQ